MSLRVGLTGGIGSGKSTVAGMLAALGAKVVDTDAIARELTLPGGEALPAIAAAFGPQMLTADGALDRAAMRQQVFGDPQARRQLESILHPLIGQHTEAQARQAQAGQTIVFDVPLLTESAHWRHRVDKVLVVDCPEETQVARVVTRSGWSPEEVRRVMAQQARRADRCAIADAVIVNDGLTLTELQDRVSALWRQWQMRGFLPAGV